VVELVDFAPRRASVMYSLSIEKPEQQVSASSRDIIRMGATHGKPPPHEAFHSSTASWSFQAAFPRLYTGGHPSCQMSPASRPHYVCVSNASSAKR
jgi:hypothetical protein